MKPAVRKRLAGLFIVLLSVDVSNQLSHRGPFQSTGPYNHRTSTSTSTSTPTQHWRQGSPAHDQTLLKHQTTTYRSKPGNTDSQTTPSSLVTVSHQADAHNTPTEVSKTTNGKNTTDLVSNLVSVENNTTANPSQNSMLLYLLRALAGQNGQNDQVTGSSLHPDSITKATTDDGSFPDNTSWPTVTPDTGNSLSTFFSGTGNVYLLTLLSKMRVIREDIDEADIHSFIHFGNSHQTIYDYNFVESNMTFDTEQENSTLYTTMPTTETEKEKQRIFTASSFNMTTEFWTDCFAEKSHTIFLRPESIEMYFSSEQCDESLFAQDLHCEVELRVPENKVIAIELKETLAVEETSLSFSFRYQPVSEEIHVGFMRSEYIPFGNTTVRAYSDPGSTVWFLLRGACSNRSTIPVHMWLSLRQIDKDEVPGLETVFTNPTTGFIQPPSFEEYGIYLFNKMETWTKVAIPRGFFVMISLHDKWFLSSAVCFYLRFALYINGKSLNNLVGNVCVELSGSLPTVLRGRTLYVEFQLREMNFMPMRGFRLLFSFHKKSTPLRRLPDGRWNCSVPYWSEYSHHFPCNLVENCADGRDEVECPYTSPRCKRGYFRVGEKCYLFISSNERVRWNEADFDCQRRNGHLATFQTQQERDGLIALLQTCRQATTLLIGISTTPETIPPVYKWTLQYVDGTIAHYAPLADAVLKKPRCFTLETAYRQAIKYSPIRCDEERYEYMCEFQLADSPASIPEGVVSVIPNSQPITSEQYAALPSRFVTCPHQHATHTFLACDLQSACWVDRLELCTAPLTPLPPSFECTNGVQRISYTLVCDFRHDCSDSSDETFCQHLPCVLSEFQCQNGQCVDQADFCDEITDCLDGSDETRCAFQSAFFRHRVFSGPALVRFNGDGTTSLDPLNSTYSNRSTGCPDNHFRCPGNGYCLPVYARCNGLYDCPEREDEMECESYTCPGFYRCRGSKICLSREQICDSIYHCPQYDDELLCGLICPNHCICYGLSWFCSSPLPTNSNKQLRFLDATGSGLDLAGVENNTMLIHLSLAGCRITRLDSLFMPNLQSFDLRDNLLVTISKEDIVRLPNLQHLSLKGNPLVSVFTEQERSEEDIYPYLFSLDLSHVKMAQFKMDTLFIFPNLRLLNMTACGIERLFVEDNSGILKHLRYLDLRGSPITHFSPDVLQGLSSINSIFSDNYKLCCPALLPSVNPVDCKAPSDEISSCQNLLRSDIYRVFLALFAGLSLLGNLLVFFTRVFQSKVKNGFDMLTINLCVSDFLMGVYLAIIGVADRLYIGTYVWEDVNWRHSAVCKAAGFLSMLSNEMSAITVCLITLDRFLVLKFPFSELHLSRKGAMLVSGLVLAVGMVLASIPLLPMTSFWNFYSQTGICIPLPITRNNFAGHDYSFAILIVFNFVLFLFIAVGQFFIYWSVQTNKMRSGKSVKRSNRELKLAKRLIAIALSDFLCWFPVGLLGILASNGVPISGEVNVAVAIFVMPLNSALNPYLYTLNNSLEKRQVEKEERLKKFLLKQMEAIDDSDITHQIGDP